MAAAAVKKRADRGKGTSVSFNIAVDGQKSRRFRIAPGKRPVKVGRGPKMDISLEHTGVSGHHLDIVAVSSDTGPVLAVKDMSTNGTGLQSKPGETPLRLAKDFTVELVKSSVLLAPYKAKLKKGQEAPPEGMRAVIRVDVISEAMAAAEKGKRKKRKRALEQAASKKPKIAAVEDMMARCRAFAQSMEYRRPPGEPSRAPAPPREDLPQPPAPPMFAVAPQPAQTQGMPAALAGMIGVGIPMTGMPTGLPLGMPQAFMSPAPGLAPGLPPLGMAFGLPGLLPQGFLSGLRPGVLGGMGAPAGGCVGAWGMGAGGLGFAKSRGPPPMQAPPPPAPSGTDQWRTDQWKTDQWKTDQWRSGGGTWRR